MNKFSINYEVLEKITMEMVDVDVGFALKIDCDETIPNYNKEDFEYLGNLIGTNLNKHVDEMVIKHKLSPEEELVLCISDALKWNEFDLVMRMTQVFSMLQNNLEDGKHIMITQDGGQTGYILSKDQKPRQFTGGKKII